MGSHSAKVVLEKERFFWGGGGGGGNFKVRISLFGGFPKAELHHEGETFPPCDGQLHVSLGRPVSEVSIEKLVLLVY